MRLIDADVLMNDLRKREIELCKSGINLVKGGQSIYKIVNQQPTAYDVDKVCEELDSAEYPFYLYDVDGCDVDESLLKADMVESIVRRGEIDEQD